jgi:mono/diheme cytochrome c family protein
MTDFTRRSLWRFTRVLLLASVAFAVGIIVSTGSAFAQEKARGETDTLGDSFARQAKPFLNQHCVRCHHADKQTSGVRVDQLSAALEDRHLRLWESIRRQILDEAMPPADEPQPTAAEREAMVTWIEQALNVARSRPTPKNGLVRRLTVAQYRNTLRELLLLDDDLTEVLPPDAVSRDGFVNNQETLQLSPLLLETYFEVAEEALNRSLVDPRTKPTIQNFRVDLGAAINREPCPDKLILGADSLLLDNRDFVVTQLTAQKPFEFTPFMMPTKYRFIEGYQGNGTVRGWRDFDSIYHAVFACMRGSHGYPKGHAYDTVPQGLLLRPAIPSEELFQVESTYGPKANFKISLRDLPDHGRFRITVTAAKYNDGLLLDPGTAVQADNVDGAIVVSKPDASQPITIKQAGIYQVDIHTADRSVAKVEPDASRLSEGLIAAWPLDGTLTSTPERRELAGQLQGDAKFVPSPFGQAVAFDGNGDSVVVPRHEAMNVGEGDFTVAAWIHPRKLQQGGIVSLGKYSWTHGWYLDMPNNQGILRLETSNPNSESNGTVQSQRGALKNNAWQHVAAVVRRGSGQTVLFVNGYQVAKGNIGPANLDNPKVDLHIGRIQGAQQFHGEIDDVRLYRRALGEAEIQALLASGREFIPPPPREKPQDVTLNLGDRQFVGTLSQPAFLAVRLSAGELPVSANYAGALRLDRVVLTPLAESHDLAQRFVAFEKRSPRLGVHLGLRRDCGSTLSPVGSAQTVSSDQLSQFVFEGAIRNFPSPDVEKDNVNYLAGIREIGVRSEYTDGRDMPRLLIRSVEFEGPFYDTWPSATHRNIFIDSAQRDDLPRYARVVIRTFATRAYRRPITAAEESTLSEVFEKSFAEKRDFQQSVKDALQVALTSPQFLFLTENSRTPAAEPLDQYELASKLSYFLWNGPPDRRLLELASAGTLREQLAGEVTRMVADRRFARFTSEFTSQWLALDKFAVLEPDRKRFPRLTRDTRTELRQEPLQFLQYLMQHNLPLRNLIASDFVVANEVVASYYDLADKTESGLEFVPIVHGRSELGGVLSQAAIMAGLSDGRESNPVKRGAWLARRIIAEPPDDPPPNVPTLKEEAQNLSLRERLEQHRNQPGCAQCHSKIDPWGVPFEEFDAAGRLKSQPVDARSTLPDKTNVASMNDLRRYLAEDRIDQVAFSMLKHLAIYATGRSLTYNELEYLRQQRLKLKPHGYRMQDLIQFVVQSELFLEK